MTPAQLLLLIPKVWYLLTLVRKRGCTENDTETAVETYPLRSVWLSSPLKGPARVSPKERLCDRNHSWLVSVQCVWTDRWG